MKKLLAILSLLLTLCLVCGVALADGDSEFDGWSYEEVMQIHTIYVGEDPHELTNAREVRKATCAQRGIIRFDCVTESDVDGAQHFHEIFYYVEHTFGDWKVTVEPTCTTKGEKQRVCKECDYVETEEMDKLDHIWASEYADWSDEDKAAYSPKDSNLSAADGVSFDWGRVYPENEPTCQDSGLAIDFCARCGEERDNTREIDPIAHKFEAVIDEEPSCAWPGRMHMECTMCGAWDLEAEGADEEGYIEIAQLDPALDESHDWDNWFLADQPTCYEPGRELRWCKICGMKQERTTEPLKPVWGVRDSRLVDCFTMETTYYCVNCNSAPKTEGGEDYAEGHEAWTETTAVQAHEYKKLSIDVQSINWDADELPKAWKDYAGEKLAPTCEDDGYIIYECIHVDEVDHGEETGYEPLKVIIPALGHDWNAWELRYEQGYDGQENEYGYWIRDCKRCGGIEERISYYAPEDTCTEHDYSEVIDEVAPTCTEPGYTRVRCTICGNVKTDEIPATGHAFDEYTYDATCTEAGKIVRVCSVCGEVEIETIEALGHTPETVEGKEATCLEDGYTEGVRCAVCGEWLEEPETIKAAGRHDFVKVDGVEPTCTEPGKTGSVACSVCGQYMEGFEPAEIPALGHTEVIDEAVAPKGTVPGLSEGKHCSVCGEVLVEQKTVYTALTATAKAGSTFATVGQTITFSATAEGGNGDYAYFFIVFCGDEAVKIGEWQLENTISWTAEKAGNYYVAAYVVDSRWEEISAPAGSALVPVGEKLSASVSVDKESVALGEKITWKITAKGGNSDYAYFFNICCGDKIVKVGAWQLEDTVSWTAEADGNYYVVGYAVDSTWTDIVPAPEGGLCVTK